MDLCNYIKNGFRTINTAKEFLLTIMNCGFVNSGTMPYLNCLLLKWNCRSKNVILETV